MKTKHFGDRAITKRTFFSVLERESRFSQTPSGFRPSFGFRLGSVEPKRVEVVSVFEENSFDAHRPDTVELHNIIQIKEPEGDEDFGQVTEPLMDVIAMIVTHA
jgi:hypothetical protein